jgi:hypothetical protein
MLKFYITSDDKTQAQKQAGQLDASRSNPPGTHPHVWENGMGCVNLIYDYGSDEAKTGTIFFNPIFECDGRLSRMWECTSEITHRPPMPDGQPRRVKITDLEDHQTLVECFFRELLGRTLQGQEVAIIQDIATLQRRIEELEALNRVATILNAAHDLPMVLELAIERIGAALRAKAGSLLLCDEATGELVFAVVLGPVADRIRDRRLSPGQGIAGYVAQTGEALLIPDITADRRFSSLVDEESGFVTRSMLCAPLRTGRGVIGVVQLLNHANGRRFTEEDLRLLEVIALHAAAVIERATFLEREGKSAAANVLSTLADELRRPLDVLESQLETLLDAATRRNPELVHTIEKARAGAERLRHLSHHLSRGLPENCRR